MKAPHASAGDLPRWRHRGGRRARLAPRAAGTNKLEALEARLLLAAEFELADLLAANGGDGSTGFVIAGLDAGDEAGFSVSSAGDFNGDGFDDVLIGARYADPSTGGSAGETYVVFGKADGFAAEFDLAGLLPANGGNGTEGFVLEGVSAYDYSGVSVSGAGDVNGDGFDDLLIGAHQADPDGNYGAGETYLLMGGAGPAPMPVLGLSVLDTVVANFSIGLKFDGGSSDDYAGRSVSAVGDVNGDGFDDLAVGAYHTGAGERGQTYIVFGRDSLAGLSADIRDLVNLLPANGGDGSTGFVINGISNGDYSGFAVRGAGDVNGDGFDDVAIGAPYATRSADIAIGESYVVFGRSSFSANFNLVSLRAAQGGDGSAGFILGGVDEYDQSGKAVGSAGDINGDGFDDLLVGADRVVDPGSGNYSGQAYVILGKADGFAAELDLGTLLAAGGGTGADGFVLQAAGDGDFLGIAVSAAGDVNGDGLDDLVVGAEGGAPGAGRTSAGQSFLVYGKTASFGAELDLASLLTAGGATGDSGLVINGVAANNNSGPLFDI